MRITRNLNSNSYMGHLESTYEIKYRITENDYAIENDVALVLDTSASMEHVWLNHKERRIEVLKESVEKLLKSFYAMGSRVRVFMCLDTGRLLEQPFCDDNHAIKFISQMYNLNVGGNTNLGDGMRNAYWSLKNASDKSKKIMILLTDGETNSYTTTAQNAESDFKLDEGDSLYTFKGTRALQYAQKIAELIAEQNISTYAAALTANTPNQLESIASLCNAMPLENGSHCYQIRSAEEIGAIYSDICKMMPVTIPVMVTFNEVFPHGVKVISVPEGLKISQQTDRRYCVKGILNDTLFVKNDSTGIYGFNTWEGAITVKYAPIGVKQFNGPSVSYVHPSGNIVVAELDDRQKFVSNIIGCP